MKKHLLTLTFIGLATGFCLAQGTWVPQATGFPNTSTGVFNISVVDSHVVWISAYDGAGTNQNYRNFSTTIDGGATWIPGVVPAPAGHAWSQIFGLDSQTAWAVLYNAVAGWGGGIWKTTDGGVTWNQQGAGQIYVTNGISFPNIVHFWDANNGWAQGDPVATKMEMYTTSDGGATWVAVPPANIPAAIAPDEYGIVNHYQVVGDTIWFDTNKGRVFRSVDRGITWTAVATGLTVPANAAMDIVFWNATSGLARVFNGTTGTQTARRTTDGGLTWNAFTPVGNMLGNDIAYVPGTTARLVSTGANVNWVTGSSFSDDGGLTWTDIETGTQRTALGVWDINTMWAGGFTTSPTSGGIFTFQNLATVACGDPSITPGVITAPDYTICFGDTLFLTTTGPLSPTVGTTKGFSVIVSTGDISGNPDPLNQPGIVGGTGVVFPQPASINTTLINNGNPFAAGVYYFTPVVYGNATGSGNIFQLTLDPTCTYTGTSVMVTLYAQGNPACSVGLNDPENNPFSINAYLNNSGVVQVDITSSVSSNAHVELYDITGRQLIKQQVKIQPGSSSHELRLHDLASGAYLIRIGNDSYSITQKFVRN
jgi:hypothetical protein